MTTRKHLIAGNWKMNGTQASTTEFFNSLNPADFCTQSADYLICPPATCLHTAQDAISGQKLPIATGSQTMDYHESGAYTGELSTDMILETGATHAIIGHSERRQYYNETDDTVSQKVEAAINAGLIPIACVGETLDERDAGQADTIVTTQTQHALSRVPKGTCPSKLVIAYEPVWAIGTGKTCDSAEANRVCGVIRATVARLLGDDVANGVRILYGGSVKPGNAAELFGLPDIDGGLIGGASLKATDYTDIAKATAGLTQTACSV